MLNMIIPQIHCSKCHISFDAHLSECPNCHAKVTNLVDRLKIFCSQCGATKHILLNDKKMPDHPDNCHACGFEYDNN